MKISVIMPTYNSVDLINQSIESILNQTYENFELLICDDSSTDDTKDIITNYKKLDSRIKIFENSKNIGFTKSLNKLITQSKGELIARQDSDDISFSNRFEKQINYIVNQNYDVVVSRALRKHNDKIIPKGSYYFPPKFITKIKNPFIHGTLLIKKNVIKEIGGYDENFYYSQDYKLFSDLLKAGYNFKHLREPLYLLNMKDNISANFNKEQDYYARCVRNNEIPSKPIK